MGAAERRAPGLTQRCVDAGYAGLSKMPAHTRAGDEAMAMPGWIVHVLVLGGIAAAAAGILLLGGG